MHVVSQGPYISDNGKLLLIELVGEQEAIWNPNAPSYSRAELKFEAWRRVQDQMKLKGFDFTVNFLRKQWNHLLVYWKKDIKLKKKPGREWPFGRSMNFLCQRYGITNPHCSQNTSASSHESAGGGRLYAGTAVKPQVLHADADSDAANILSTDLEVDPSREEANARMRLVRGDITPPPIQGAEMRKELDSVPTEEYIPIPQRRRIQRDLLACEAAEVEGGVNSAPPATTQESNQGNVDKFGRYAAFLASTLRDMPEAEARTKMKKIMMVLLDDVSR